MGAVCMSAQSARRWGSAASRVYAMNDNEPLHDALRRAAVINAALLKMSAIDLDDLDTSAFRAALDAAIGVLEKTTSALSVRMVERQVAEETRRHLTAQEALLRRREEEFTNTVTLLTDAVVQLHDANTTFTSELFDRSDRLEGLKRIDDIRTLRSKLESEITGLRAVAVAKQEADSQRVTVLSSRIESLEARLAVAVAQGARDQLTGLNNRAAWDNRMEQLDLQLASGDHAVAMAVIDLDRFKQINDRFGHKAGDAALVEFAALCGRAFDADDFVARFGGDEFAVLLAAPDRQHAADHVLRLIAHLRRGNPERINQGQPPLTLSAGLALARPGDTSHTLFERADQALYAAKEAGRDGMVTA